VARAVCGELAGSPGNLRAVVATVSSARQLDIGPARFPERADDDPQAACAARHGRPEGELTMSFAGTVPAPATPVAFVLLAEIIDCADREGGNRGRPMLALDPGPAVNVQNGSRSFLPEETGFPARDLARAALDSDLVTGPDLLCERQEPDANATADRPNAGYGDLRRHHRDPEGNHRPRPRPLA
jgi:hypothetical protein